MIVVINVVKKIKIKIPKDKRFKRFCLTKTEALDVGEAMNRTDEYLESCTSLTGKLNELSHTCFPLGLYREVWCQTTDAAIFTESATSL